jgi:hypothetical protein
VGAKCLLATAHERLTASRWLRRIETEESELVELSADARRFVVEALG